MDYFLSKVVSVGNSVRMYFDKEDDFKKKEHMFKATESPLRQSPECTNIYGLSDNRPSTTNNYPMYINVMLDIDAVVDIPYDCELHLNMNLIKMIAVKELPMLVFLSNNMTEMQFASEILSNSTTRYLWLSANSKSIKFYFGETASTVINKLSKCKNICFETKDTKID